MQAAAKSVPPMKPIHSITRRSRPRRTCRLGRDRRVIEWIGFIGGTLFAAACIPMAFYTWRAGRDLGTPLPTQWLLFIACLLYAIYLYGAFGPHLPFAFLLIEVICWGIALWFHYRPRHEQEKSRSTLEVH